MIQSPTNSQLQPLNGTLLTLSATLIRLSPTRLHSMVFRSSERRPDLCSARSMATKPLVFGMHARGKARIKKRTKSVWKLSTVPVRGRQPLTATKCGGRQVGQERNYPKALKPSEWRVVLLCPFLLPKRLVVNLLKRHPTAVDGTFFCRFLPFRCQLLREQPSGK
jgi:hypothetical protein